MKILRHSSRLCGFRPAVCSDGDVKDGCGEVAMLGERGGGLLVSLCEGNARGCSLQRVIG